MALYDLMWFFTKQPGAGVAELALVQLSKLQNPD
jgi:hypothetical protein